MRAMISNKVINQLIFFSNAKYILEFIKSHHPGNTSPPRFSLNSIKPMPESLLISAEDIIMRLALMNVEMPSLSDTVKHHALSHVYFGNQTRQPASIIENAIEETASTLRRSDSNKVTLDLFEQAVSNYRQYNAFCYYDWRLTHWGTTDDILTVVESTFALSTAYIEFETKWTPPIRAMETLATTFPSVRFELKYRLGEETNWVKQEIFPNPPFGY
jgi:hypothetical protein